MPSFGSSSRARAAGDLRAPELRDIGIVFAARRFDPSYLNVMAVADADGRVVHASIAETLPSFAERPYFIHHRDNSDPRPHFTKAAAAIVNPGIKRFTMSRRLETADGEFAGVVVAFLDVEKLAREYARLRPRAESSFALIGADGALVTRTPYSPDFVGQIVQFPKREGDVRAQGTDGGPAVFFRPTALDGAARLIVQCWLDRYPFVVGATLTMNAIEARWRREWPQLALVWCLVALATIAGGLALARQAGRASAAREAFTDASRDLEFYKYALDQHAIVGITDVGGNIVYANDKFCEISQYARGELLGQNHRILNSGQHSKEFFRDMWRTIARGEAWRGEIRNRAKDGSFYWVDTAIVPLMDARGKPFRYFAIRIDITQHMRMEADLLAAKTEAEAANRFKSELLANTSHELRTPLNAVIGFSEIMKTQAFGPLAPRYRDYAADIHNAGRHLLRLVNDILDVSAIDAGRLELHEESLDLADLLKGVVRLIRHRAETGRVDLRESIPEGLPRLFADERRVKQIALNLLSNAIKFNTPGGSAMLEAGRAADGSLFFRVVDTGIGMDEKEIAVAMSKFGQVDSSLARAHEGTGLGLPLAKSLTELHGGRFSIESAKGQGTTATVTFPPKRTVGWS
jgi:PAS domain S-box-containing protein